MARGKVDPAEKERIGRITKRIGIHIRKLRELMGEANYEKFALKHDLNRSQFWRYENGEDMRVSSLLRVIKALDVRVSEFFKEEFEDIDETENSEVGKKM